MRSSAAVALIRIELGRMEIGIERRHAAFPRERDCGERAVGDKAIDDAGRAARPRSEHSFWRWRAGLSERRENAAPRLRHACRRLAGGDEAEFRRGRFADLAGADRHAQEHSARSQGPTGRPVDEVAQRGAERRPVEDLGDGLEVVAAGRARGPHDAGGDARAERHVHEGARFELRPRGRAVAIGGVDGDRAPARRPRCSAALRRLRR